MLTVGQRFPEYRLKGVVSNDLAQAFVDVDSKKNAGRWQVWFFWPKDFTFVCPTEIKGFADLAHEFSERDALLYGASTDSEFVHLAWRRGHEDLRELPFPMVSDIKRELSTELGILDAEAGVPLRATFIADQGGIIRHITVNDLDVGRSPAETLRVLDGLQSGELCPCNWQRGEATLQPA